jgi:hypothetical protein
LPARSVTAVVTVAVYLTPAAKSEVGFSVAVSPSPLTDLAADTVAPLLDCTSVKEEVVMVDGRIGSLNVATTLELAATFVGSGGTDEGMVDTTVGGVVSGAVPATVNDHTLLVCRWLPARSVTAVVTVAMYLVPAVKEEVGFSVAVSPSPLTDLAADTVAPSLVLTSVKEDVVMVDGRIGSLNVAKTLEVAETPVAWSAGEVDTTVGGVVSAPAIPRILISFMLAQSLSVLPLTVTLTYRALVSVTS